MSEVEELIKKQNELRDKRNALYKEIDAIESEINKIELERFNLDDLIGKYIIYRANGDTYYMKITDIKRLIRGPRLVGRLFYMLDEDGRDSIMHCYESNSIDIDCWEDARKYITFITEEDYVNAFDIAHEEIKKRMTR